MADFTSAFYQIPPVTRVILLSTAAITVPCLLQFIAPYQVALSWKAFGKDYEIWRPFTAFFFGGAGFPLIYDVFLIYRNSSALEKDTFLNDTAEYAWMHVVVGAIVLAINAFLQQPFLFRPLLHAQTYLWNRANPTMKISLFGLLTIPTSLYSPALVVLDLVTGGPDKALGGIMGILAGHVWWFCSSYLPLHAPANLKRSNPLRAPIRWKALFNDNAGRSTRTSWGGMRQGGTTSVNNSSGSATALQSRPQDRSEAVEAVRHRWGGGQKLGGLGI